MPTDTKDLAYWIENLAESWVEISEDATRSHFEKRAYKECAAQVRALLREFKVVDK